MMTTNTLSTLAGFSRGQPYLGLAISVLIGLLIGVKFEQIIWRKGAIIFLNSVIVYSIAFGYAELTLRPGRGDGAELSNATVSQTAVESSAQFSSALAYLDIAETHDLGQPLEGAGLRSERSVPIVLAQVEAQTKADVPTPSIEERSGAAT